MGNCCTSSQDFFHNAKQLIRVIQKEKDSKITYHIQIFNSETEQRTELPIFPKFFQLKGMSQIFQDDTLYLCGSNTNNKTDEYSSSFLYSINILKQPLTVTIEVNTCYLHYYPSLSILKNDYLIVIGGLNSCKCECYSFGPKRWKELPILPEERYQGNVLCDNISNFVYLFGGYDLQSNRCCMSILKLNMNLCVKWDTIILLTAESNLIAKAHCCNVQRDNGEMLILGGIQGNNRNKGCNEIVQIDIKKKNITTILCQQQLNVNVKFEQMRFGIENSNGVIYFFDDGDYDIVYRIDNQYSLKLMFGNEEFRMTE